MKITLTKPKEIVVVKEMTRTISEITIDEVVDNGERKTVTARTLELGPIVLWEGDAYDTIGQWTDNDVIARIKEIYAIK